MASLSSSHNNNNGILLSTQLEWYKIRDTFFGQNKVSLNIPLALHLAATCQHPDAHWLTEACAGKDVTSFEAAKRVFSALGRNDARALCFLWMCCTFGERQDLSMLHRSAELGFAFAQALMGSETAGEERFKFAQLAAAQGERDGFGVLGRCFRVGEGCEKDLDKAKENFLRASELGRVWAMIDLGDLLGESDPQRWRWWGRAAALGDFGMFLSSFVNQVELFNSCSGCAVVMFAIGQALQGHVVEQARTIFSSSFQFDIRIGPAKQAIAFYEAQILATKDAMHAWTQVGLRWNVVKDVRKLIAKLIWDSREEALYKT
jgi:TPR repeat protein